MLNTDQNSKTASLFHPERIQQSPFTTRKAILIHQQERSHYTSSDAVLTVHPVHNGEQGSLIGAGHILNKSDEHYLLDILQNNLRERDDVELLPPEVLVNSHSTLVWTVAPRVAPMYFNLGKNPFHINVPWPRLIFMVKNSELYVAALKTQSRPSSNTPLYHAPIMNTYARGNVCTGTAVLPEFTSIQSRSQWEDVIYRTNNSHVNQEYTLRLDGKKSVSNSQHLAFWKQLAKQKQKEFPKEALHPMNRKLGRWIKQ